MFAKENLEYITTQSSLFSPYFHSFHGIQELV